MDAHALLAYISEICLAGIFQLFKKKKKNRRDQVKLELVPTLHECLWKVKILQCTDDSTNLYVHTMAMGTTAFQVEPT